MMEGKGKFEWFDGRKFEGIWKEDKMNGKGIYIWPNKDGERKYEGEYVKDKKEGTGVYTWQEG